MDEGDSILGAIYEDESIGDGEDVEMLDIEEGELVDNNINDSQTNGERSSGGDVNAGNQRSQSKNRRRRANKKKNKKKPISAGPNFIDIDRFVSNTCKRLKEKKSYMVYTAVGCLGISALSDLVKEVEAIQACGGQITADGRRFRTGGGVLWSVIKVRAPEAYKEIMKKTREFEKQFRQQNNRQVPEQIKEASTQCAACQPTDVTSVSIPDDSQSIPRDQAEQSSAEGKRKSVHDRIRVPVSYDDLLVDAPKNDSI